MSKHHATKTGLAPGLAALMFAAFAFSYFLSALLRAVTATLAPAFSVELGLRAADLGLLAGAYFVGFAMVQLPLGYALDRLGPRRVLIALLALAVVGCAAFAVADTFTTLLAARVLIGIGVSACLMAPLTAYRHHFGMAVQLRANSWMLMTGSLGMLASTLPVHWLLPFTGWRGLFWAVAVSLALAIVSIAWLVPADAQNKSGQAPAKLDYRAIFRNPYFLRLTPIAAFTYGGLVAVQSLWAGPWLTDVVGQSASQAAGGLFLINFAMLLAFLAWGVLMPVLSRRGWSVNRLIACGLPLSLALLSAVILLGSRTNAAWWAAWCVASTFVSLSQPALAQSFPADAAGRALSAFNLVIFSGVFAVQWGIGIVIDALQQAGWQRTNAFQAAFAAYWICCACAYLWFLCRRDAASVR